jgi:biopolymer transport protein TolR
MNGSRNNFLGILRTPMWTVMVVAFAAAIFMTNTCTAQALQKGISVQLASSVNSAPMPEADNDNAFIVTVTSNGAVYLGMNRMALPELKERVRNTPFQRTQKIYIKVDAQTPYATVLEVLDATRTGGIAPQVLLTADSGSSTRGTIRPPQGVELQMGPTRSTK